MPGQPKRMFGSVGTLVVAAVVAAAMLGGLAALDRGDQEDAEAALLAELKRLAPSDWHSDDFFGTSVSISGDVGVIGAPGEDGAGSNAGAAFIFRRDEGGTDNWGEVKKLLASDAANEDRFGTSVSIDGTTVIVGAPEEDTSGASAGAAYVFERDEGGSNNWGEVKKIVSSDAETGDEFGASVAVEGDTAIIGAPLEDTDGSAAGAAYVFQRDAGGNENWGDVTRLMPSDGGSFGNFGASVAMNGEITIVGASAGTGKAYLFGRHVGGADNWGELKILTPSGSGSVFSRFGTSVAVSEVYAVVGAPEDDSEADLAGAAYLFARDQGGPDNWGEIKKTTASDAAEDDRFGRAVNITGNLALVGAPGPPLLSTHLGAVYLYQQDYGGEENWGEGKKVVSSDPQFVREFGYSISKSGDTSLIGARRWGSSAGAAYIFEDPPLPPTPTPCPGTCPPTVTPTATATPTITPTPTTTPTPTVPPTPEMGLSLASGGSCSLSAPTTCFVPAGQKFEVSIDAIELPDIGYVAAWAWVHYGDDLGDQGNGGQVKDVAFTWPDCTTNSIAGSSDQGGNSNHDSVSFECSTFTTPPGPISTYTGNLFTFSLTCTPNETSTLLELIPQGESPAGDDGAHYWDPSLVSIVPKVNDLTVVCADEVVDTDGDGCTDLREIRMDPGQGGLRDPANPWDFYDVSGDRVIELFADVLQVIAHFSPNGTEPEYDSHYDRGPSAGPNPWDMTAPDGKIELFVDILGVIAQAGHDCR